MADRKMKQNPSISEFEKFKNWLHEQNAIDEFAQMITDGTTVYFSDDFAAAYDLRIIGKAKSNPTIIVQLNLETQQNNGVNEDFLKIAVNTWRKMGCEVWYLDKQLNWLIVDNEKERKHYNSNDMIKSEMINFQFKLEQVK
ncbi:MAG: hypothetical protein ACWA41_06420 [Putridiphycobacter sp.]